MAIFRLFFLRSFHYKSDPFPLLDWWGNTASLKTPTAPNQLARTHFRLRLNEALESPAATSHGLIVLFNESLIIHFSYFVTYYTTAKEIFYTLCWRSSSSNYCVIEWLSLLVVGPGSINTTHYFQSRLSFFVCAFMLTRVWPAGPSA